MMARVLLLVLGVVAAVAQHTGGDSDELPRVAVQSTAAASADPVKPQSTEGVTASLEFNRHEVERLKALQTDLTRRLIQAQVELSNIDGDITREARRYEESRAELVVQNALPSPRTKRRLTCMGWKKTSMCRWTGRRNPALDKSCFTPVPGAQAGYCEVRDDDTREYFRVMRSNCSTMPEATQLWCQMAPHFANFPAEIKAVAAEALPVKGEGDGIVLTVTAAELPLAKSAVHKLRAVGCNLPIEIWYVASDASPPQLHSEDNDVRFRPLPRLPFSSQFTFFAKIYAIASSSFARALYVDASATPLRDPTSLFASVEFAANGAVFWPHVFHPMTTESNIQAASLVWELLDIPFVNAFEQDDRLMLIRRDSNAAAALRVLQLFAAHRPNLFEKLQLVSQGKDLFRLAWLALGLPFHVIAQPPALGGSMVHGSFCGTHLVQYDTSGELVFSHAQYGTDDAPVPTHVQEFDMGHGQTRLSEIESMHAYLVKRAHAVGIAQEGTTQKPQECYQHTSSSDRVTTREWKTAQPVM